MCDETRASLEADEFVNQVNKENHKFLMENDAWYKRAYEIIDGSSPSLMKTKLYIAITKKIDDLKKESYNDTRDAMLDEAAYASNPMAYYGMSWSDFI